ncbi:MAG: hypothetical protein DWQ10_09295 [Calditrichaeota bacterium]|nr:MAG: hypothetical protein DWQ10_09295 [Calditrichota bacterium]
MPNIKKNFSLPVGLALKIIIVSAGLVLYFAPVESNLGSGILYVYIHAAAMQAGKIGLLLVACAGLVSLFIKRDNLLKLIQLTGWISLIFYVAGILISIVAAKVNWGEVFLAEPRYQSSAIIVLYASTIFILADWMSNTRYLGIIFFSIAPVMLWVDANTKLILHPENPVGASPSTGIKSTFFLLFILNLLALMILVYKFYRKK